jgi:hypothetical protein
VMTGRLVMAVVSSSASNGGILERVWCVSVMTGWPLADVSGILLQLLWLWNLRLTVMTGLSSSLRYVAAFAVKEGRMVWNGDDWVAAC